MLGLGLGLSLGNARGGASGPPSWLPADALAAVRYTNGIQR
jgi:hypothetical protein